MDFYSRYEDLCKQQGIDPCSQKTADILNTTRANISNWKKGTKPNSERVRDAADMLHTTTDYLLGRTDNPNDFTLLQKEEKENALPTDLLEILMQLDDSDLESVAILAKGCLDKAKYQKSTKSSGVRAI